MTGIATTAQVIACQRLSPHFQSVTFSTSPVVGGCQPVYDQRVKLLFPTPGSDPVQGTDWYQQWLATPAERRATMRTFSIRRLTESESETQVVVDFVLHPDGGPAAQWAAQVRVGDELTLVAPIRGQAGIGKEFAPGQARHVVLVGDETAAPAICSILEELPATMRATALIEVPTSADVLPLECREGIEITWMPREGAPHGLPMTQALLEFLGPATQQGQDLIQEPGEIVWETPTYSASGEPVLAEATQPEEQYYWIAGESRAVAALRRRMVRDYGIARHQIAFMGYWRLGSASLG